MPELNPSSLPLPIMMLTGGISGCLAEIATIPIDTTKVRLQIQGNANKYTGFAQCFNSILREEGFKALFKGLSAGLHRQMLFASLRIGLYEPVKKIYAGDGNSVSLLTRILAAMTTGAIGITIANPTDVVKIRFQGQIRQAQHLRRYKSVSGAYSSIVKTEGVLGLWTGLQANIMRNATMNAAQLAVFDQIKESMKQGVFAGNNEVGKDLFCSGIAGFVASLISSPVDVVKTRLMNAKVGDYGGIWDCISKTRREGLLAFYKGFSANALRVISWNTTMFVCLGRIRSLVYEQCYRA